MTEETHSKKFKFSPLWIMPIIALAVTGWLILQAHINRGVDVTLQVSNSVGIKANKTPVLYRGLTVGKVKDIQIMSSAPDQVEVTINLKSGAEDFAREGTDFWIVKPTISVNEISGLETVFSGSYITMKPITLDPKKLLKRPKKTHFVALKSAPSVDVCKNCKRLKFRSDKLDDLRVGSGIYFKGFKIGKIDKASLNQKIQKVDFEGVIAPEYAYLLEYPIYVWNRPLLEVDLTTSQLKVTTDTIESLVEGRLELGIVKEQGVKNADKILTIQDSEVNARKDYWKTIGGRLIKFQMVDNSNVSERAPIFYKKILIGELGSFELQKDLKTVSIDGYILPKYKHLLNSKTYFYVPSVIKFDLQRMNFNVGSIQNVVSSGVMLEHAEFNLPGNNVKNNFHFFNSQDKAEEFLSSKKPGLRVVLFSKRTNSITPGAQVYYRQIPVGVVESVDLESTGQRVIFKIFIEDKYKYLVRNNSKFFNMSGIRASMGISGMKIETGSVKSVLSGGLGFVTPTVNYGDIAKNHESFPLYDRAQDEWMKWSPVLSPNKSRKK